MSLKKLFVLFGVLIVAAAVLAACGGQAATATTVSATPTPTKPVLQIPNEDAFLGSGHADAKAEAFNHWSSANPAVVPAACAKCHTSAGFQDFAANGKVSADVPAPAGTLDCMTCHNAAAMTLASVTFPSGQVVNTSEEGEAVCMQCHQGRESKVSVDKQIANFKATDPDAVPAPITDANGKTQNFGFLNIHYFAAGATLYGSQAEGGYQYDGKTYDPKFRHVEGMDTCVACHDQHSTTVRVDKCATCHTNVKTVDDLKNIRMNGSLVDYNGNGNTTEGIAAEISGLQDILYSSIQAYASEVAGAPIVYDANTYPYFFSADSSGAILKDDKGNAVGYQKWTPHLLEAAFNYQVAAKDPGAFAHNAKYIIELLYDSIDSLNGKISKPVDMSKLHRDDSAHFAGNTMPFRDWDDTGTVPSPCSKCHSAGGLPQFIANKGTEIVTKSGLQYTGLVAQPTANGFMCSTCHDMANMPNRLAVVNVPFPNGASLTFSTEKDDQGNLKPVDSNLCLECHQGRESTVTVNNYINGRPADTVDPKLGFKNVHYLAAGATLFGTQAQGAYEYAGQTYVGYNAQHPLNNCTECHDAHALTVKTDACKGCHTNVNGPADLENIRYNTDTTDWNGNGDTTEGIYKEIDTFRTDLYAAIQNYAETKAGTPIVYDGASYPYFFVDANKDGKADTNDKGPIAYNAWTPRLLEAAYNYQYSTKDPGAFAHNPMYVMQFLYDSTKDLGGDVSKLTRPTVAK
ncbi:MAG: cytochrome c3 family protein [Chloroflexi bacterium]|nr:cytochrome c3 family protein [Chloroflexota bacterium]